MTNQEWTLLTRAQKDQELINRLQALCDIRNGKHELAGKYDQGKLVGIRQALEQDVFNIFDWENENESANIKK